MHTHKYSNQLRAEHMAIPHHFLNKQITRVYFQDGKFE